MKNRTSKRLTHHQNELRKRALKEKIEDKRVDYWRLYFEAQDIAHEVNELVMEAEIRRLLELMTAYGVADIIVEEEKADTPPDDKPQTSDSEPPDHEDNIPPRQKGLWD